MSAYKRIQCALKDRSVLIAALKLLGLETQEHDSPQTLYGFEGRAREQTAEIVVPRVSLNHFTGASNDLGFTWNEEAEQFDMVCSDYDEACKVPQRILQAYALAAVEAALVKGRFRVERTSTEALRSRRRAPIQIAGRKLI